MRQVGSPAFPARHHDREFAQAPHAEARRHHEPVFQVVVVHSRGPRPGLHRLPDQEDRDGHQFGARRLQSGPGRPLDHHDAQGLDVRQVLEKKSIFFSS